ncbi:unnamed protein product [Penicillium egyptiacum]|uniref:MPN domain-containing protein n=1 Tax=Penicillium egyptiacum TaxID=1303716 RepID=A0A9W4K5D6_9EURO|nr:unnamed protein product [Penicillium egyptiacum]
MEERESPAKERKPTEPHTAFVRQSSHGFAHHHLTRLRQPCYLLANISSIGDFRYLVSFFERCSCNTKLLETNRFGPELPNSDSFALSTLVSSSLVGYLLTMDRLNRMLQAAQGMGMGGAAPGGDTPNLIDNSETVHISSLALLKMLRHGRAGVPMEVMGLMLGEFVDEYTVRVVDVFAMPQSGTGVSVEAVDEVFQSTMMEMLQQTGRPESVVGWYHSHPGFGCWLSSVDINTQQAFEQLTPRAVAVVVDPIQSVKGKVVIDAFRLIQPQTVVMGQEPRQTTSNLGHLNKPSIQALIHGLNRHYYSIGIDYRKTGLEENMLMNLHKHVWTEALEMSDFHEEGQLNVERMKQLVLLAGGYEKRIKEETEMNKDQLKTRYVGKLDPKKHIEDVSQQLIEDNIVAVSRQMIDKEASVARQSSKEDTNVAAMEVDEDL